MWRCFSSSLVFSNTKWSGASSFNSYSSRSHQPSSPSLIPHGPGLQFSSPFPLTFLLLSARGRSHVSCWLKPLGYVSFFLFIFLFIDLYFGLYFFPLQLPAQWPWIAHWKKAGASPRVCPASPRLFVCMLILLNDLWHLYFSYIQVVLDLNNQSAKINGKNSPRADARLNLYCTCYWLILSSKQPCGMGKGKYEYYYSFIAD